MIPTSEQRAIRISTYSALLFLVHQGYRVVRVAHRRDGFPVPFQLIAWNDPDHVICIRVGGPVERRKTLTVQEELTYLCGIVRSGNSVGELQFWIKNLDSWVRYRILAGGAVLIPQGGCDIR